MVINLSNAALWTPIATGNGKYVTLNVYSGDVAFDPNMAPTPAGTIARATATADAAAARQDLRDANPDAQEYTMLYSNEDQDGTRLETRVVPEGYSCHWAFISGFEYEMAAAQVEDEATATEEHHD